MTKPTTPDDDQAPEPVTVTPPAQQSVTVDPAPAGLEPGQDTDDDDDTDDSGTAVTVTPPA